MKGCMYFQEQIEFDLDGELSAGAKKELTAHLHCCAECRQYLDSAVDLWKSLDTAVLLDPPGSIAGPVLVKIRKGRSLRLAGMVAIVLLTMLGFGSVFMQSGIRLVDTLLSMDLEWIPNLLGSLWNAINILLDSWQTVVFLLPDEYWLGLSALVIVNLAFLIKVLGLNSLRGEHLG